MEQIDNKKIAIAAPFGVPMKMYSFDLWLNFINKNYPENPVIIVLNGKSSKDVVEEYLKLQKKYDGDKYENDRIKILMLDNCENMILEQKLAESRNACVHIAKVIGCDYIFWLDSDTIPYISDPIERLLSHKKQIVSGLYNYKGTRQPVVMNMQGFNFTFEQMKFAVINDKLLEASGFGFGCVLMHKDLFEIKFDYSKTASEDIYFCEQARKQGFKLWFDPVVFCHHYTEEEAQEVLNVKIKK